MWRYEFMSLSLHLSLSSTTLSRSWKISSLIENQCFSVFHFLAELNLDENYSNFCLINVFIINSHMYFTCNCISCQSIFHLVNNLLKIIIIIEKARLIRLVNQSASQLISHNFQLQSNFWWLLLILQLCQNLNHFILTSDKKLIFVMIKINMNVLSKINHSHFILLDYIML